MFILVLTPGGEVINLEAVKRSKSGRILKPCVYWWAGQRVKVTEEGLVVQSSTEYGSRYVKEREDEYLVRFCMSIQGFSYCSEIRTRGLLILGKKHLGHQNWEELILDCHFK